MEIDDLLPEKPLSTLFFHGIFWKSKTSNTVDFPKAFPEILAWAKLLSSHIGAIDCLHVYPALLWQTAVGAFRH